MIKITNFKKNLAALKRAERVIPLGSQTFSKSRTQLPVGAAPLMLSHGNGSMVWDVDGNEYVDMVNGLLCVLLGYKDPDVDAAIVAQLDKGISFSLATELEADLAERLVEIIPSAEMVRFGKNGTDATSAAVRLARAVTRRDRVIASGYHGWQDWYIGATTRNSGVPDSVSGLTTMANYNDLDAIASIFKSYSNQVACVILEPLQGDGPEGNYLVDLKRLCQDNGALLIFDEIISGFRFALGGAQEYLGVTPDLAAFGKGMGNGMPISAVVGAAEYMQLFEDVFFSGTFGGEALSLAASIAVIDKIKKENVIEHLWRAGKILDDETGRIIKSVGLEDTIRFSGVAPWRVMHVADHANATANAIKTSYLCEAFARGVLTNGGHNISYAFGTKESDLVVTAYEEIFEKIALELKSNRLVDNLPTEPVQPVFAVRS